MSPESPQNQNRRKQIIEHALSIIENNARREETEAVELLRSKANLDGPMQSKQPDEMIRLEYVVGLHRQQFFAYKKKSAELRDLLDSNGSGGESIESGSVFVWDLEDPDGSIRNETVIVIPSGGGEFEDFRLLSLSAPLTKAILGKKQGDKVRFGEVVVTIKEII